MPNPPGAFTWPHSIVAVADVLGAALQERNPRMQALDPEVPQPGLDPDVANRVAHVVALLDDNYRALEAWMAANISAVTLVGNADGAGNAVISHGISRLSHKVLLCQVWYRGSVAGSAGQGSVTALNDSTISISTGLASSPFRLFVQFSETEASW